MDEGLRKAINKYRKAATLASESVGSKEEGPFLVAKAVSKYAFEQWSAVQEKKWQLFWNRLSGDVWLYGDPSPLHETAHSFFTFFLGHLLKSDAVSMITTSGSPSLNIPAGIKGPDFAFGPLSQDDPTVVGEVAYHNENFKQLVEEEDMWSSADFIQFFIGLKITDRTRAQRTDPKMTCITWRRDTNESNIFDFGSNSECNAKGQTFLELPIKCLFHHEQVPQSLIHQEYIKFDLYDLRQRCKKK